MPGIVGTARPVFGAGADVVGAISIATAAVRYDSPRRVLIADAIGHAVQKLSRQLRQLAPVPAGASLPSAVGVDEKV